MQDSTYLIKYKRDQLRNQIRKNELENIFRSKRIIDIACTQNQYWDIHIGLCENVEKQAQILVQNKQTMFELLNSNEKTPLIILANCCASESFQTIQILVQEYQIHKYFMNLLSSNTKNNKEIIQKCYAGLANLLFSDQKQVAQVKFFLYENSILQLIVQNFQQQEQIDTDLLTATLRLLCGLLKDIDPKQKKAVKNQDIVEIFSKVINWMEIELLLSIHVLILSTQICQQLLELFDDEKFNFLVNKIEISQDREACLIIRLIDELFLTAEKQLIISFLDNSHLDCVLKNILKTQYNYSKQAVLDFLYNRVVSSNQTIQQFVFLLYDELLEILNTATNEKKIDTALKIVIELTENELIEYSEKNKLFETALDISDKTFMCSDLSNCILALQLVLILKSYNQNSLTQERKKKLRQMQETQNEDLEDIIIKLLES